MERCVGKFGLGRATAFNWSVIEITFASLDAPIVNPGGERGGIGGGLILESEGVPESLPP